MDRSQEEFLVAKKRLKLTKYLALVAFCASPLGLLHSPLMSLLIFTALMILCGVTTYIAFMHHSALKNRLKSCE